MKKTAEYQTLAIRTESIVCDKCKTEIDSDDMFEFQEIISLQISAGYGSILGDGNQYEVDLCQKCVKELLGEYLRLTGNYIWGNQTKVYSAGELPEELANHISQSEVDAADSKLDYESPDSYME